jgi:clusterin-associated protein 1
MELIGQESNSGDGPVINSAQAAAAESLAIEIADIGESIQNLLRSEANDSTERVNAIRILSDDQERHSMELEINHMIHETNTAVERLDRQCKMLISNNKGMEEKIRKRSIDLERNNKRLESLTFQTVRPAFMDEYEQIEKELQVEYERYVVRFRNVDYLERELQSRRVLADERATAERSVKRMQRKYRQEELAVLEGGDGSDIDHEVHARNSDSRGKENSKPRENEA